MRNHDLIWWGRAVLLALALVFLTLGLAGQEEREVLQKAVTVCLECIGIG